MDSGEAREMHNHQLQCQYFLVVLSLKRDVGAGDNSHSDDIT